MTRAPFNALAVVASAALIGACTPRQTHCSDNSDCASWQYCDSEVNYCLEAIAMTSPDAGAVGPQVTVRVRVNPRIRQSWLLPAQVEVSAEPNSGAAEKFTASQLADGQYMATWNPLTEGEYRLTASYPTAGLSAQPVIVEVDKTPPDLQIVKSSPLNRPGFPGDCFT
jgi:hypothetical protein